MRLALLDPTVLDRVDLRDPPRRWQAELHAGGWLVSPVAPPTPELEALKRVGSLLGAVWRCTERVERLRHPLGWMVGGVETRDVVIIVVGISVLAAGVGATLAHFWTILEASIGGPVTIALVGFAGLGAFFWQERQRKTALAQARGEYESVLSELSGLVGQLSASTFLIHGAAEIVISAPHLAWLGHRLRDLRECRPPVEPPERKALVDDLNREKDKMEAALRRLGSRQIIEETELLCPLKALSLRFQQVQERRGAEGRSLSARLEDFKALD